MFQGFDGISCYGRCSYISLNPLMFSCSKIVGKVVNSAFTTKQSTVPFLPLRCPAWRVRSSSASY